MRSVRCGRQRKGLRVADVNQVKSSRFGGIRGALAITPREKLRKPSRGTKTSADQHKGTCDIAHHMMKEGIRLYIHDHEFPATKNRYVLDIPHR